MSLDSSSSATNVLFQSWGKKTIVPKHATECQIGQREGLSDTDIRKINTLYKCSGYPQVFKPFSCSKSFQIIKTIDNLKVGSGSVTVEPTVRPSCEDNNRHCALWAYQGECNKNPGYMLENCPVACDQC